MRDLRTSQTSLLSSCIGKINVKLFPPYFKGNTWFSGVSNIQERGKCCQGRWSLRCGSVLANNARVYKLEPVSNVICTNPCLLGRLARGRSDQGRGSHKCGAGRLQFHRLSGLGADSRSALRFRPGASRILTVLPTRRVRFQSILASVRALRLKGRGFPVR
jgi:hypothetical protein